MLENKLLKKLADEKFGGHSPKMREATWGEVNVFFAEDNKSWYYAHGDSIYVQAKEGDHTPHCYACGSEIEFKEQTNSVHFEEFGGLVGGGEVRIKHIPYCPTCEKEPEETGIITESTSKSLF
jgi:hypothetical protein